MILKSIICKFLGCGLENQEKINILNNKINQKQCELGECIMKSHELDSKVIDLKFKSDTLNKDNACLRASVMKIANERDALTVLVGENNEKINSLTLELDELKKKIPVVDPRLTALELKYPPIQTILYKGWNLNGKQVSVPVNDFIMPDCYFVSKFVYESGVPKTEDHETAIPKLYKYYYDNIYSYLSDIKQYGLEERWDLTFELFARYYGLKTKGFADCEGNATALKSVYTNFGFPDWKCRIFCGNVPNGSGHATNSVFSEVTGRYHNLNSTYGGKFYSKISEYPTVDDGYSGVDPMGIKVGWFSFSKSKCYLGTFNMMSEKGFKKHGKKLFEIIP